MPSLLLFWGYSILISPCTMTYMVKDCTSVSNKLANSCKKAAAWEP
ncbi:hypothetical protein CY0110_16852 [Crocosphaera chwakensis CCY0110]|uniref:Uncharacterized protein n=1 Tax=Crocosphaera chwakensis CCY0110 TaxID=391612 RepID=A3II52_9CHRO|nr:hypothetical protein CY0110_16852 [Crocosphaera chwakensis CCY0110]